MGRVVIALILALASCSSTYHGVARATHARSTCAPKMLVDLDFAATLALLTGSALAMNADHPIRASLEAGAAIGIAFGGAAQEVVCR